MARKILIVDDEINLARILEFTLESAGYETIVAHDGREGLEKAFAERPDLVILDLTLPVIDGALVCKEIKRCEETRSIIVAILTAHDLSRVGIDESIGADLWMEKPFRAATLLAHIARLLARKSTGAE